MTQNKTQLEEISRYLMRLPADGLVDVLRLVLAVIAQRMLDNPDWLLNRPDEDQQFIEQVMQLAALTAEPNDGPRH